MMAAHDGYQFCCGIRELGDFTTDDDYRLREPAEILHRLKEAQPAGQLFHTWFHKEKCFDGTFDDEYQFDELRQLVRALPGVVHLGEHLNPNSGNMIDGYFWKNQK